MTLTLIDGTYAYPGRVPALAGVSVALSPGERVAVVGANGSGKTTLLLALAGALRLDTGEVRLDGLRLGYGHGELDRWRRAVGLVVQDPDDQLFAPTVGDDVAFGPLNLDLDAAEAERRVEAALGELHIGDLRERPTHMLSLGQKKRVALAGAIAMRPRLLLFDEPTAGLDPLGVVHLVACLSRLTDAGTGLLASTHDVDLAFAWSSRVIVLHKGRVLGDGPPETVLTDPSMLRKAHLRPPLLHEIGLALQARGLLPPDPLPRNRRDLLNALGAGQPA